MVDRDLFLLDLLLFRGLINCMHLCRFVTFDGCQLCTYFPLAYFAKGPRWIVLNTRQPGLEIFIVQSCISEALLRSHHHLQ
ncbi:hypothetical protein Hamer_G010088 [Homarus americanus]|uniref:Secreted protein n=1 Tax=Homarus americanus TaxID=6706 RepID=A0A8J5MX33_HOMAM|nr:hypothetical protein Hamer_G010088 [Homarus americanus]